MRRDPLDKATRSWRRVPHPFGWDSWQAETAGGGHLTVMVSPESDGLHLSISHRTNEHPPKPDRYPTWDEIADARERFLPDDRTFAMLLPPSSEYVALHETTFHLYELTSAALR